MLSIGHTGLFHTTLLLFANTLIVVLFPYRRIYLLISYSVLFLYKDDALFQTRLVNTFLPRDIHCTTTCRRQTSSFSSPSPSPSSIRNVFRRIQLVSQAKQAGFSCLDPTGRVRKSGASLNEIRQLRPPSWKRLAIPAPSRPVADARRLYENPSKWTQEHPRIANIQQNSDVSIDRTVDSWMQNTFLLMKTQASSDTRRADTF